MTARSAGPKIETTHLLLLLGRRLGRLAGDVREESVDGRAEEDEGADEAEAVVRLGERRRDAAHVALGVDDSRVLANGGDGEDEAEEEEDELHAAREVARVRGDGGADDEDGCERRVQVSSLNTQTR